MTEDELQSADAENKSDSAPDSEGQHEEKVTFDEKQQAHIDKIVGEQTFKRRKAERELQSQLEAERKAREELEAKVSQSTRPEVPPVPDPYEDDFQDKVAARDEAIRRAAEFDAQERGRQEQSRAASERSVIEQAEALRETAQAYTDRAIKLGMTQEELSNAGQMVQTFGVPEDVATFILHDEHGPLITKYLARHADELDAISRSGPGAGLVHVASIIKQKAAALSAKTSDAPSPPEQLEGGGMPQSKRGPSGAVYE